MKFVFLAVATLLAATVAHANQTVSTESKIEKRLTVSDVLKKGALQIGGGLAWGDTQDSNTFSISPEAEYFVMDRLSVGGEISYYSHSYKLNSENKIASAYGLGPSATYYFYEWERSALFVSQQFGYTRFNNSDAQSFDLRTGRSAIGIKFLLNDAVAFGIDLSYKSILNPSSASNVDSLTQRSLSGNFSIFY